MREFFWRCEYIKLYLVCQLIFVTRYGGALLIIARRIYRDKCLFDQSTLLLIEWSFTKAIIHGIKADLSFTPQIFKALRPDALIPRIFMVSIKVIVIHFRSKWCRPIKITGCSTLGRHKYHGIMKRHAQKTAPFNPLSLIRPNQPMCR